MQAWKNEANYFPERLMEFTQEIHTSVLLPMGVPRAQQQLQWSPVDKQEKNQWNL